MENQDIKKIPTIDFLGSEGLEIDLLYDGYRFCDALPRLGTVNQGNFIPSYVKNCIPLLNSHERLTHPLKKTPKGFVEISFEEAFDAIEMAVKQVNPQENAFFAGARLSNETLYLMQKLARAGVKSNNIGSFHYFGRDEKFYDIDKNDNVQFDEIEECEALILLGNVVEKNSEAVFSMIQKAKTERNIPLFLVSNSFHKGHSSFFTKKLQVNDFYTFVKALNHYIITNNLQSGIFVEALSGQFYDYKNKILSENSQSLLQQAGISEQLLQNFVKFYLTHRNSIVVYSEEEVTSHTVRELLNFCLLTERLGFPYSGILGLKERNNSQGLFDMGINTFSGPGGRTFTDGFITLLKQTWNVPEIATKAVDTQGYLFSGKSKNVFVFGEDPIGCAHSEVTKNILEKAQFIAVQDYFMTETARLADIVLPDTFPFETGGSFTNTTKIAQPFPKVFDNKLIALNQLEQLAQLCRRFGIACSTDPFEIFLESATLFEPGCSGASRHKFVYTENDSASPLFVAGCDDFFRKCK